MSSQPSADADVPNVYPDRGGPSAPGIQPPGTHGYTGRRRADRRTLTDKSLAALKPARAGTRYTIHDGRTGLAVRVTDKGERSFIVRPLLGQGRFFLTLGNYPETTLEDARALARGALQATADGVDPRPLPRDRLRAIAAGDLKPRVAARDDFDLTFGELAEKFLDSPAVVGKPSEKETRRTVTTYFLTDNSDDAPAVNWKSVTVGELDGREINAALELLVKRGRVQANHCAQTLNRLFRWAAKTGRIAVVPVFNTMPGDREEARSRVLAEWELREIWKATESEPVFGLYIRFLIATGLRRSNAASIKWAHVDRAKRLLTVPRTKERRAFVLPLSELALSAIDAAGDASSTVEYVFSVSGKPLNAWSKMTARLRKAAPRVTERWTLHDLRRTMRTGLGQLGIEYHVAERCIDHVVGSTAAQAYDRWAYFDVKRDAFDRWAKRLREIVGAKGGSAHGRGGTASGAPSR